MMPLVDCLLAILLLVALMPLLALIALLIRLDSPGPALYIPPMVGRGARLFPLLRFRTMAVTIARWEREGRGFDRIVSSPLVRARTMAELIAAALSAPLELDPLWLEMDNAPWPGSPSLRLRQLRLRASSVVVD